MALKAGDYSIALDTYDPNANVNFVSHAHSDHISGLRKEKRIIASEQTIDLLRARKKSKLIPVPKPGSLTLLNSGHMLGSKQLHVSYDEYSCSVLYSGDYQMQESSAAERIETREADILILDSTYPYQGVEFDERDEVITAIQHYTLSKIDYGVTIFGAYTMGKAQELVKILNESGIAPFVSDRIANISEVYKKHNIKLDYLTYENEDELADLSRRVSVGVVDVSKLDQIRELVASRAGRRVFTAVATGFAKIFRFKTDIQFALSDHADFKQAVEYINLCNPKTIFTCGSSPQVFARNLGAEGYNAHPITSTCVINDVPNALNISRLRL